MIKEFNKNERVVFLGDSITHCNSFINYIYKYYSKHEKDRKVRFYNAGIAGARIDVGLRFYDEDFMKFNPTTVVMMYGMNDSFRYALSFKDEKEKISTLNKGYRLFKSNLDKIYKKFVNDGLRVILCTPTPYDEVYKTEEKTLIGGNKLISKYARYVRTFAKKNNLELIDYNKYMNKIIKKHSNAIKPDHVHPTDEVGHYYMAKYFLSQLGHKLGSKHLSKTLKNMHTLVYDYRDIFASEFLFIPEGLNHLKRIEYAKGVRERGPQDEYFDYYCALADKYVINASKREHIFNAIDRFIDKIYK